MWKRTEQRFEWLPNLAFAHVRVYTILWEPVACVLWNEWKLTEQRFEWHPNLALAHVSVYKRFAELPVNSSVDYLAWGKELMCCQYAKCLPEAARVIECSVLWTLCDILLSVTSDEKRTRCAYLLWVPHMAWSVRYVHSRHTDAT